MRPHTKITLSGLACVGLLISLVACQPLTSGQSGTLYFRYITEDTLIATRLATPIATGAQARIGVLLDADGNESAAVTSATSANPAVLEVVQVEGASVVVEGVSAGNATLTVNTQQGTDSIELTVSDPATWVLAPPATLDGLATAPVIEGGTVRLGVRITDSSNRALTGYGMTPYTISPPDSATIVATEDTAHLQVTVNGPGPLTITPPNGTPLQLQTVSQDAIATLSIEASESALEVGQSMLIVISAQLEIEGDEAVGLRDLATITATEGICSIQQETTLPAVNDTWAIQALGSGTCEISVVLGELLTSRMFEIQ